MTDRATTTFNLADLFELVADAVPGREAVVHGGHRITFAALDERAARLASVFAEAGVGVGDGVALVLKNSHHYVEAMLAAFKLRAIPVNVNRHYVVDELRHLLGNADPALTVCDAELTGAVGQALQGLRSRLLALDGEFERARDAAAPQPRRTDRRGDDDYVLYTGGTTGLPKAVCWRHKDLYAAALGGGPGSGPAVEEPPDILRRLGVEAARTLVASPLMHGTAQWAALAALLAGDTVLLSVDAAFDPVALLNLAEAERAAHLVLVGDAFARPMADALDREPGRWSLDGLVVLASGGAALSPAVASRILDHLPGAIVIDGYGTSETGGHGRRVLSPGIPISGPPRFSVGADTAVLGEDLRPLKAGEGVGRLARRDLIPQGYRNDAEATARTFPMVDGERWAVTGDLARVEEDGSITLLGRGERLINTGGEKVYPGEVEAAMISHPDVIDAVAVGIPHRRFGEQVAVVVVSRDGATVTLERLRRHCRPLLARFKLPRKLVVVGALPRAPSGKIDYAGASRLASRG